MKKYLIIAAALLTISGVADGKSYKRGVSENSFMFGSQLEVLAEGSTWYYNWGNEPGAGYKNSVKESDALEFVPMVWNANYSADKIRNWCKAHPETKYLLGFNEPNFKAQANMTPQYAAEKWPEVQALAKELGLKLVAPALNYSPDAPYTDPLRWMDEFVAIVGKDAFDFTAIHCYGGLGVMKTLATNFHNRYGKDVWVTEFCYWPGEGGNVTPATQISSMIESVKWLESTPWIYRYAWFKATGNSNASSGPNYGLLVSPTPVTDPWQLSEQGIVYTYLSSFGTEMTLPIGEMVAASDFNNGEGMSFGSGYDSENPELKLHITQFTGSAYADYKYNIEYSGDYRFVLRVSGYGEPARFDPSLRFTLLDSEGKEVRTLHETGTFSLPNSDEEYMELGVDMTLDAGPQYIRVSNAGTLPSGIRLASVRLVKTTAVEAVDIEEDRLVNVYNLQGIVVKKGIKASEACEGLAAGLYIVEGNKVIVY